MSLEKLLAEEAESRRVFNNALFLRGIAEKVCRERLEHLNGLKSQLYKAGFTETAWGTSDRPL